MQTEEHNNGQRSPPSVPKTGPYLQRIIKVVLGCQTINGINPRSAIRQQQLVCFVTVINNWSLYLFIYYETLIKVSGFLENYTGASTNSPNW
jgi:hypothetical protein